MVRKYSRFQSRIRRTSAWLSTALDLEGQMVGDPADRLVHVEDGTRGDGVEAMGLPADDERGDGKDHGGHDEPVENDHAVTLMGAAASRAESGAPGRRAGCSDADALGQQLAVVGGIAEEQLGALGPLEVQVGRDAPR